MNTPTMTVDSFKPYIMPVAAAVILIAVIPLLALPWVGDIQDSFKTMSDKQTKLDALKEKVAALQGLQAEQNKATLTEKVEPVIPSQADPAGLLGTLEQVAVGAGASTQGVRYGQDKTVVKNTESGSTVETNLSVVGGYANIVNFIRQSETVARVVSLTSLHIVPSSDEDGTLVATFDVSSPYQPFPEDLGPAEEPLPQRTSAKEATLTAIDSLHLASYAPTSAQTITGKDNPF